MSGLGEKIKEVFSGHHHESHSRDVKTPDVDAPGAFPADEPTHKKLTKHEETTKHTNRDSAIDMTPKTQSGHQHHVDPETEAKQATSAAGNYPYWGDLPKEGEREVNRESAAMRGMESDNIHSSTGHSGLEKSALATGAGAAGAGYLAHEPTKSSDEISATATSPKTTVPFQKDLADHSTAKPTMLDNASTTAQVDPLEYPPKYDQGHGKRNEELAGASLAGAAGVGYLAHKKNDDHKEKELEKSNSTAMSAPSQIAPSSVEQRYAVAPATQQATTMSSPSQNPKAAAAAAAPGDYHDYKKEEALAGGAGLASLGAGAGYLASRNNENFKTREEARPSTIAPSSTQRETTAGGFSTTHQADPTVSGGIHNTVVGAGSVEDSNARRFPLNPSSDNNITTVSPKHGAGSSVSQQDVTHDLFTPTSHDSREKQDLATAAGVGAGAGVISAEKHHHDQKNDNKHKAANLEETSDYQGTPAPSSQQRFSNTTTTTTTDTTRSGLQQQPAQAAAKQAWNNKDPTIMGTGHDHSQPHKADDSLKYGAMGAAAAVAGAGATAAYYGQGKEHDQNPHSAQSEKVASRALGPDGSAHAPTTADTSGGSKSFGYGPSQGGSSRLGYVPAMVNTSSSSGSNTTGSGEHAGAKVLHKCKQCGADNDITEYFNKEASFRMGS